MVLEPMPAMLDLSFLSVELTSVYMALEPCPLPSVLGISRSGLMISSAVKILFILAVAILTQNQSRL